MKSVYEIVIAVENLEEAVEAYEAMGFKLDRRARSEALGIDQAFFTTEDGTVIELAQPFDPDKAVGKGLARNGEGLYMIAMTVDDVETSANRMKEKGIRLVEAGGRTFVHPSATKGILMRLDPPKN
ncbi:MAG: VOC family protein [Rhodospirillaceae bacterium]|nr:VOC family protein [Rhodospirillaceae bacterium]MDD9926738.1 VOC family protein [Rhodospirillaceae bacterium]